MKQLAYERKRLDTIKCRAITIGYVSSKIDCNPRGIKRRQYYDSGYLLYFNLSLLNLFETSTTEPIYMYLYNLPGNEEMANWSCTPDEQDHIICWQFVPKVSPELELLLKIEIGEKTYEKYIEIDVMGEHASNVYGDPITVQIVAVDSRGHPLQNQPLKVSNICWSGQSSIYKWNVVTDDLGMVSILWSDYMSTYSPEEISLQMQVQADVDNSLMDRELWGGSKVWHKWPPVVKLRNYEYALTPKSKWPGDLYLLTWDIDMQIIKKTWADNSVKEDKQPTIEVTGMIIVQETEKKRAIGRKIYSFLGQFKLQWAIVKEFDREGWNKTSYQDRFARITKLLEAASTLSDVYPLIQDKSKVRAGHNANSMVWDINNIHLSIPSSPWYLLLVLIDPDGRPLALLFHSENHYKYINERPSSSADSPSDTTEIYALLPREAVEPLHLLKNYMVDQTFPKSAARKFELELKLMSSRNYHYDMLLGMFPDYLKKHQSGESLLIRILNDLYRRYNYDKTDESSIIWGLGNYREFLYKEITSDATLELLVFKAGSGETWQGLDNLEIQ